MRFFVVSLVTCVGFLATAQAQIAPRTFGAGEHSISQTIRLGNGETLRGAGMMATTIYPGSSFDVMVRGTNEESGNRNIAVEDLTIDCRNRADFGVRFIRTGNLQLRNVAIRNCRLDGARISGHGVRTRGFVLDNIRSESNGQDGIIVMWAMRDGLYSNIYAEGNGRHGVTFDHSEFTATNVVARNNTHNGVFLRNLFATTLNSITATHNGGHGILVQGWVMSTGNAWRSQSNGKTGRDAFDDIHFSGDASLSYGATRDVSLNGVVVGDYVELDQSANIRHGIHIARGVGSIQIDGAVYGQTRAQAFCRGCVARTGSAAIASKPGKEQAPPAQHTPREAPSPLPYLDLSEEEIRDLRTYRRSERRNNEQSEQREHDSH